MVNPIPLEIRLNMSVFIIDSNENPFFLEVSVRPFQGENNVRRSAVTEKKYGKKMMKLYKPSKKFPILSVRKECGPLSMISLYMDEGYFCEWRENDFNIDL
jgi:hypothetical protein